MQSVQLGKQLGNGGFGTVYECEWKGNKEKKYAIKISSTVKGNPFILHEDVMLRHIYRDSNASNKNIIRRYGIEQLPDGRIGIVFELLLGSLNGFKKNIPFSYFQKIIRNLARAVSFIHEAGIIHSDIKPANILVGRNGVIKLADFGMAFYKEPAHHPEWRVQPLGYRSPEVVLECEYGIAIDIWSFAAVIVYLLVKKHVFDVEKEVVDKEAHLIAVHHKRLAKSYPEELVARGSAFGRAKFEKSSTLSVSITETMVEFLNREREGQENTGTSNVLLFDLLDKMFVYDPKDRITAAEILEHPFVRLPVPEKSTLSMKRSSQELSTTAPTEISKCKQRNKEEPGSQVN